MCVSREVELKAEVGLEPRHSEWDVVIPSGILTPVPNSHPYAIFTSCFHEGFAAPVAVIEIIDTDEMQT